MNKENTLNHIAVIIDGNRRWAKSRGLASYKGHEEGAKILEKFLDWCKELGINETTAYILSTENLKRDALELKFLFDLFRKFFKKMKEKAKENQAKVKFIGDLSLIPKDVKEMAESLEKETESFKERKINFCMAYGGRLELVKTFNKLKNKQGEITEEDITNSLWLKESPELIIRTGDAMRTSNFLPWQSVYSEWVFLEKCWPDFSKEDLISCIENFSNRKRNFGK